MKMPSGRANKREAVSKSPIDKTLLATWQRHNSSRGVYQRITRLFKQAGSLFLRMSHYPLDVYTERRLRLYRPPRSRWLDQYAYPCVRYPSEVSSFLHVSP